VQEALLAAILAAPDDDLPRLAYADWLEEHGELKRSSFIRLQLDLARWPRWEPRRLRVQMLERARAEGREWVRELPPLPEGLGWSQDGPFERGFAERLVGRADCFVAHADEVCALAPVRTLELIRSLPDEIGRLAGSPALARLRELRIPQGIDTGAVLALGESPHAQHLEVLKIAGPTPGEAIEALVATPLFSRLVELDLAHGYWATAGPRLAAGLGRLQGPCRLEKLNLYMTQCGRDDLATILDSPLAGGLIELNLGGNNLGAAGWGRLTRCAALVRLQVLEALSINPGKRALSDLVEAAWVSNLRWLSLSRGINGSQVRRLAAAASLSQLTYLDLGFNGMGDPGGKALASSPYLTGLAHLNVAYNNLGEPVVLGLVNSSALANVFSFDLAGNHLDKKTRKNLRRRKGRQIRV
jgi:uncharacterized protein (TIGR02996 family)